MDPNKCQVLTQTKGTQCSKAHKANSPYCTLHETKREEAGPHQFARTQLEIKHRFERSVQADEFNNRRVAAAPNPDVIQRIDDERIIAEAQLTVRHRIEYRDLLEAQHTEIVANDGINPDEPARIKRELNALRLQSIRASAWIMRHWARLADRNHFIQELEAIRTSVRQIGQQPRMTQLNIAIVQDLDTRITDNLDGFMARAMQDAENGGDIREWGGEEVAGPVQHPGVVLRAIALPAEQQLARIANDSQNVHTQLVVEQTKKNIAEILKIPVPRDYQWEKNRLSLTYKTIVMFCNLSPKSVWQFSGMYCSDATIYEMEPGIFGKVVDGVWQYISKSPDRKDLKKILATELRDNIGMCAQGNLSRICNVLQGYLEGIGQKESIATILGREFPKLMEIENVVEREARGVAILRENAVPEGEWNDWLDPLRE